MHREFVVSSFRLAVLPADLVAHIEYVYISLVIRVCDNERVT